MIKFCNGHKFSEQGSNQTYVLRRIDLDVGDGEFVSIIRLSGAEKVLGTIRSFASLRMTAC